MQNFRTLGLIIKKVHNLFNLSDKYGKIIRCVSSVSASLGSFSRLINGLLYYYYKASCSKYFHFFTEIFSVWLRDTAPVMGAAEAGFESPCCLNGLIQDERFYKFLKWEVERFSKRPFLRENSQPVWGREEGTCCLSPQPRLFYWEVQGLRRKPSQHCRRHQAQHGRGYRETNSTSENRNKMKSLR